ncbi:MAG: autotransporter outer membrane beta-barrel domain-containing protein, partial [Pseudomonadota bacterium]
GTLDVDGGTVGDVDTTGTGVADISGGTVASLDQASSGTSTFSGGTVTGAVNVTNGTLTVDGGVVQGTTGVDGGQLTLNSGTLTGDVTVTSGTLTANSGGAISGNLTSDGGTTNLDTTVGGDVNNNGGSLSLTANGDIQGTLNNAASFTFSAGSINNVNNSSSFTVSGTQSIGGIFTNGSGGTLDLDAGASFTVTGALSNEAGGVINVDSGEALTASSGITNTGAGSQLNVGGTVTGDVSNVSGGQIILSGTGLLNGTVTNTADFDITGGTVTNIDNNSGGDFDISGTGTVTGTFTNAGEVDLATGSNLDMSGGTFVNESGGTLTALGTSTITGGLNLNSGSTLSLDETAGTYTPTTLTVTGDATLDGTIEMDLGASGTSAVSDLIVVNGSASGTVGFDFNIASDLDDETGTTDLITVGGGSTLSLGTVTATQGTDSVTATGNTFTVGSLQYTLDTSATGVTMTVGLDGSIGNFAAGVGLTQSVVGSIVNRPTSPYVTDYVGYSGESRARRLKQQASSAEPCGAGAWARASFGQADSTGSFDINATGSTSTDLSLNYQSIQAGGDFACFDDRYNGFDMSFGAIAGYSTGSTDSTSFVAGTNIADTAISTDFSQAYAGIYATASRGSFFADLQLRFENLDYETDVNNIFAANGTLDDVSDFSTKGTTLSGAVGYSWQIPSVEGLAFVGTAGFSYSSFDSDAITISGTDSLSNTFTDTLQLDDSSVELGFVSGTLSRSRILPNEISAINYFGTLTYYNDFADAPTATLQRQGSTVVDTIELSNLGSYGEVSVGVNYIQLLDAGRDGAPRQFSAAARVDYRSGSNVDSYGVTGQVRWQW